MLKQGDRGDHDSSTSTIVVTKLKPPRSHITSIARPRLTERLNQVPPGGVGLVVAPAGYGKTTAVAALIQSITDATAWLSLDQLDANPVRFWQHVWASCASALPEEIADPHRLDHIRPHDVSELALPTILNALATSKQNLTVVLDDLHLIDDNSPVMAQLDYVIDRLPTQIRLVLATRAEPNLRLDRLRVQGALVELRADQLSFSQRETAAFLNDNLELGLSPGSLDLLLRRTEGWAAGMYLAALSLEGHQHRDHLVERFAADTTITAMYLTSEVLAHLDARTTDFLLRVSVLERFNPELAFAVTDVVDSARCIQTLVKSNMFVERIDGPGQWHRTHPLFRNLLANELALREPDLPAKLHSRAVDWHLARDQLAAALHHAAAIPDTSLASSLLDDHWVQLAATGNFETMRIGLATLGNEQHVSTIGLKFAEASVALHDSRTHDVDRALTEAEQLDPRGMYHELSTVLRAVLDLHNGSTAQPNQILASITDRRGGCSIARPIAWLHAGSAALWAGDATAPARLAATMARLPSSQPLARVTTSGHLAIALAEQLDLDQAEQVARSGIAEAHHTGVADTPEAALLHAALGLILRRRGRPAQAMAELTRSTAKIRRAGPLRAAYALLLHAGTARQAGQPDLAKDLVVEARDHLARCPEPGPLVTAAWERESRSSRTRSHRSEGLIEALTERELEQLQLLPTELSQRQIAEHLIISFNTVKTNNRALYRKLNVTNRQDAVATAQDLGLL